MTVQSKKILTALRKTQRCEGSPVRVETGGEFFYDPSEPSRRIRFPYSADTVSSIMEYLTDRGLVRPYGANDADYVVTHVGNHALQEETENLFGFFAKSVLVPLLVSAAASVVANLVINS